MGKVKSRKSRIHLKATKVLDNEKDIKTEQFHEINNNEKQLPCTLEQNPFFGLHIDPNVLSKQSLIQDKNEAAFTSQGETRFLSKKNIEDNLGVIVKTKKGKMNRRRELFLQKLEINQRKTNQQKKAKQKAKNTVVGDLHEIKNALTEIPHLTTDISESITKTKKKCRSRKRNSAVPQKQVTPTITDQDMRRIRSKRTQKYMLSDIAKLQSVLKDKSFKRNSKELILKNLQEQLT